MISKKQKLALFFSVLLLPLTLLSTNLQAKTVVLVHGYLGDGMSWRTNEVTKGLMLAGWKDGGGYGFNRFGMLIPTALTAGPNAFFTVDLPSKAPVEIQANVLSNYLEHLYAIRKEPIVLVGHSAGGVVARAYLVRVGHVPTKALVTISAPHLGTPSANFAIIAEKSPMGMMLDMVGQEDLKDSRRLFKDLKKSEPDTYLYWLNHQLHPNIHYVSIIRTNKTKTRPNEYDFIVPPESQNMNNIWALKGRSLIYLTKEGHFLTGKDGYSLIEVFKRILPN